MEIKTKFDAPFGIIYLRLDKVKRWGIIGMAREQSVAEHCYNTAIITEHIAREINMSGPIIFGQVLQALHHDDEEAYTGDIPGICKNSSEPTIVKLADTIEAYRYASMYCNDTQNIRTWLLSRMRKKILDMIVFLNVEYDVIRSLMEDV